MSLVFELEQRKQASRYARRGFNQDRYNYIGALMTISALFAVGLVALCYYEYHRYQQAMNTPANDGCVISKSEARQVLHIVQAKPEKRK